MSMTLSEAAEHFSFAPNPGGHKKTIVDIHFTSRDTMRGLSYKLHMLELSTRGEDDLKTKVASGYLGDYEVLK